MFLCLLIAEKKIMLLITFLFPIILIQTDVVIKFHNAFIICYYMFFYRRRSIRLSFGQQFG